MNQPSDIDPDIHRARALMAQAAPGLDVTKLPAAEGRLLVNQAAMALNDGKPELPHVETIHISGPAGRIRTRLYQPDGATNRGAIYYIHGGGWFACDVDTHDRMLRFLAAQSGLSVFAIDYRLSPEHVYPAALEDCQAGWQWLYGRAPALKIDGKRIAIAGDSAGANLALALSIAARIHTLPIWRHAMIRRALARTGASTIAPSTAAAPSSAAASTRAAQAISASEGAKPRFTGAICAG